MMRRVAAVLAALVLCGLVTPAAAAGYGHTTSSRSDLSYAYGLGPNIQNPVEQETDWPFPADPSMWVINPARAAPCAWDVDDMWMSYAQGTLGAGESLTVDECMIASPRCYYRTINGQAAWWCSSAGFLGQRLQASESSLTVSVCWQPQGRCFTPAPVYDAANRVYVWSSCARAQYDQGAPALVTIPDSQGGVGLYQTVTVTVTNPTGRNVRNVFSDVSAVSPVQIAIRDTSGCPEQHSGLYVTDYPFTYYVS